MLRLLRHPYLVLACLAIGASVCLALLVRLSVGPVAVSSSFPRDRNYHTSYMCTYCRAVKNVKIVDYNDQTRIETSSYTQWYNKTQPPHEHRWGGSGSSETGTIMGCGGTHPVYEIREADQKAFLQRANIPERQAFFQELNSDSSEMQRQALTRLQHKLGLLP
jgi:hypothetical protein